MRLLMRLASGLLGLSMVLSMPALANDISNSTWSESDGSNNHASPNGWTSGVMLPSQVEPTARAMMGAMKRFYNHINGTATSGGTANAQTLTYAVAPTAYVAGDLYSFVVGSSLTNTGAATLNINSLGAIAIQSSGQALVGGELLAGKYVSVVYDGTNFQLFDASPGTVSHVTTLTDWGGDPTGVANSTAAMNAALAWAISVKGTIVIPAGTFLLSSVASATIPANTSISIVGVGTDQSFIASSGNALALTYASKTSALHIRDMSFLAKTTNAGTAVNLIQTNSGLLQGQTDITGVTFRGSDGYGATNYWTNGVLLDYVSNVNFSGDNFFGPSSASGVGINLFGGADSSHIGIVYNVTGSSFENLAAGVQYGAFLQGVSVNQSNFVSNTNGIYVPSGSGNRAQLAIANSQFGFNGTGINQIGAVDVELSNNEIFAFSASQVGASLTSGGFTVVGNAFGGQSIASSTALVLGSTGGTWGNGTIVGNSFANVGTGISADSHGSNFSIKGNIWTNNTTNITSTSTGAGIAITGLPGFAYGTVSGAANNGSGLVRLTMSTTGFVNGMAVLVGNVGGIPGIGTGQFLIASIAVIDSTHIDLFGVGFGGSYTGGGLVSTMP